MNDEYGRDQPAIARGPTGRYTILWPDPNHKPRWVLVAPELLEQMIRDLNAAHHTEER